MSDSLNGRLFYYPVHTEQNECGYRLAANHIICNL